MGGDVLDLKDLLTGENNGNLGSYLEFAQSGGNVVLTVHSQGGVADHTIVLQGVTMGQLGGGSPTDSAGVIANLLSQGKLITDA